MRKELLLQQRDAQAQNKIYEEEIERLNFALEETHREMRERGVAEKEEREREVQAVRAEMDEAAAEWKDRVVGGHGGISFFDL